MASDDEIRMAILEGLYHHAKNKPEAGGLGQSDVLSVLSIKFDTEIPSERMTLNMLYLEEKGLINLWKSGSLWYSASITPFGVDVYEHPDQYHQELPFIPTDFSGQNAHAVSSEEARGQATTDPFDVASEVTRKMGLTDERKADIFKHLVELKAEITDETTRDAGTMQRVWGWLKDHAPWVVPILAQKVKDAVIDLF